MTQRFSAARGLAEWSLIFCLPGIFLLLLIIRPPAVFYTLLVGPVSLAAVLYRFTGGALTAAAATAGVAVLIGSDPNALRRSQLLLEAGPILATYLFAGPLIGWFVSRKFPNAQDLLQVARKFDVVTEIAEVITSSLDLGETLDSIFMEMSKLVNFDRGAVLLYKQNTLHVAKAHPDPDGVTGSRLPAAGTAALEAMQNNRIWLGGPEDTRAYEDTRLVCSPREHCILVPLRSNQTTIGVLAIISRVPFAADNQALQSLVYIARYLAIAIEHARLFGNEQRRVQQLAAIGEAAQDIAAALDLRRTLRLVMEKAATTLPLDAGAIFQYSREHNAYQVAVSHRLSEDHVRKITFGFADGVPGWVVKHRLSLIIEDARNDRRVHPFILDEGVCSVLAVPLIARGQVVGVLNLYRKSGSLPFGSEARQLAQTFAAQAAYAIENARLVGELREAAQELEARVQRRTMQLKESQAHIVRTEKLAVVGRLATSVAHEVNNPLQAIMLQLELLAEEGGSGAQSRRLHVVQEEVARISEIVQRLLDFQRPKKGESQLYDVAGLLKEVLQLTGKKAEAGGVTLELHAVSGLPMVEGSGDQLKQVFLNLVLNALEAMPGGGKLLIDLNAVSGNVEIRFIDTGPGMPPEVLTQLFEPFFTTKTEGTGLGLAISHEIITQHNGRLSAQTAPGEGSTFLLTLPAAPGLTHVRNGESQL